MLHPRLAPIKAAIFPVRERYGRGREEALSQSCTSPRSTTSAIGLRYRRQDGAGTLFCITVDGDTMKDGTVTVRDRDTLKQERIPMAQVREVIEKALAEDIVETAGVSRRQIWITTGRLTPAVRRITHFQPSACTSPDSA